MKISLKWLKDYVAVDAPQEMLAHKITMAGIEVEKIIEAKGDAVFEVEITPNRPDCLNMRGIAREVAAIFSKECKFPKVKKIDFPKRKCDIEIQDKEGCRCYFGIVIDKIKIGCSPEWIKERIEAIGMRSINNVVDITNFCLMETGQPFHAFDYDKLKGGKIVVRRARKGEKIITIDEEEKELDPSILVIADEEKPVAIAGIMGGKATEVTFGTKRILLESAYFDPVLIRRASRKLGIMSDSSYRFERGVDFDMVEKGVERATSLILEHSGGSIVKMLKVVTKKMKKFKQRITISKEKINSYLGADLSAVRCKNILKKLGFDVALNKKREFVVSPPSFRADIKEEVDIIEEVARITGYDNLPTSFPVIRNSEAFPDVKRKINKVFQEMMLAQGLNEVVTYSMISFDSLRKTKQENLYAIKIQNPLTRDQEIMRPSMLPGLLSAWLFNLNRGQKDIKFFEAGKVYLPDGEKFCLGIIMAGTMTSDWRRLKKEEVGFYDIKGAVEQSFERVGINNVIFKADEKKCFETGQSAVIFIKGKEIGYIGKIDEDVLANWGIKQKNIFFAKIILEECYAEASADRKYNAVAEYPSIIRDISLAVKKEVSFQDVKDIVFQEGGKMLSSIKFIEEYLGDKIPSGSRGMVVSLNYQAFDRTLREEEVNPVHEKLCQALIDKLGAVKR